MNRLKLASYLVTGLLIALIDIRNYGLLTGMILNVLGIVGGIIVWFTVNWWIRRKSWRK